MTRIKQGLTPHRPGPLSTSIRTGCEDAFVAYLERTNSIEIKSRPGIVSDLLGVPVKYAEYLPTNMAAIMADNTPVALINLDTGAVTYTPTPEPYARQGEIDRMTERLRELREKAKTLRTTSADVEALADSLGRGQNNGY